MASDAAIVSDVNQIVDFSSFADGGYAQRGAVDTGARADFHAVSDFHAADLRKFLVSAAGHDEAESVGSDDAARVQDHVVADARAAVNMDARVKRAMLPDFDACGDRAAGTDRGARADADVRAEGREGSDEGGGRDGRAGSDDGGRMNTGRRRCGRMQTEDGSGHGGARVAGADHGAAGGIGVILWNHQASGLGGSGGLGGAAWGDEGKVR